MIELPASFTNLNGEQGVAVPKKDNTRSEAIGCYLEGIHVIPPAFSVREGIIRFQNPKGPFSKVRPSGWYEVEKWTPGACAAWLFEAKSVPNY